MVVNRLIFLKKLCIGVYFFSNSGISGQLIDSKAIVSSEEEKLSYQRAEECLKDMSPEQLHVVLNVLYLWSEHLVSNKSVTELKSFLLIAKRDMELSGGDDDYAFYREDSTRQAPARKRALYNVARKKLKNAFAESDKIYSQYGKLTLYIDNLEQSVQKLIDEFNHKLADSKKEESLTDVATLYQKTYSLLKDHTVDPQYYTLFSCEGDIVSKESETSLPLNLLVPIYPPLPRCLLASRMAKVCTSLNKKNKGRS